MPLAPSRVSASPASRSRASPNIKIAFPRECANARARTALAVETELATRTGERRHDDIEEKKISARARAFVRSRVAFVRARACVTTTTAREGNRKGRAVDGGTETRWMCRRRPQSYTSIHYEVPRCPTDRCIKNKTLKRCRREKSVFFDVIFVPLCVFFSRVMTQE